MLQLHFLLLQRRLHTQLCRSYYNFLSKENSNNTITLYDINTYPVDEGVTNKKSAAKVYVGGTLDAISMNQKTGNYKGEFTLEIIF